MKICKIGRRGLPLQCKGVMLIGAKLPLARTMCAILGVVCLLLTGCYSESYDVDETSTLKGKPQVVLTFVTPNSSTRSATDDPDGYEAGIEYEDAIGFDSNDYKIYFFSYSSGDTKGGTFLAEFEPTEISPVEQLTTTTYTLTGNVPEALMDVSSFRVVVLANWGSYPTVTVGTTTIDDLCEANSATSTLSTYSAMVGSDNVATMTSATNLIPFFGVQEFSGVSFTAGTTTTLSTPVSLLRAVAKVEIIITAESSVLELDENGASLVNYNSTGYCAPWQVYTADDYDTSMNYNPQSENWSKEWIDGLHLVNKDSSGNGINDSDNGNPSNPKSIIMYKVQGYATTDDAGNPLETPQLETWRAYVPEYSNMSTDYSYISVTYDEGAEADNVYFAEYTNGRTTAYSEEEGEDMPDRLNIKRNNLYRFYVTIAPFELRVQIDILPWVERQDNYEF